MSYLIILPQRAPAQNISHPYNFKKAGWPVATLILIVDLVNQNSVELEFHY